MGAGVLDLLRKLLAALRPSASNDPEVQLAWRQSVATTLSAIVLIGAFSVCWMRGWIPGLDGVALAGDIKPLALASDFVSFRQQLVNRQDSLESSQHALLLITVRNGIKQALKDRCHAFYAKNQEALDAANSDLDGFTEQYRALTTFVYPIPDCSVTLIATAPAP